MGQFVTLSPPIQYAPMPQQNHRSFTINSNETKTTCPEVFTNDSESNSHIQSMFTPSIAATNLPPPPQPLPSQIPSITTNVTSPSTSINSTSQEITPFT